MSASAVSQAEQIARLNDLARQAMGVASVVVATPGFLALPEIDQSCVRELVETFDAFTPDNDPYGERDFGAIYQCDQGQWSIARPAQVVQTVFWKVDAYDPDLRFGSENPVDPAVTRRVELAIRLPDAVFSKKSCRFRSIFLLRVQTSCGISCSRRATESLLRTGSN